jgi:hypothetical protein
LEFGFFWPEDHSFPASVNTHTLSLSSNAPFSSAMETTPAAAA